MKQIIFTIAALVVLGGTFGAPQQSFALSCIAPGEMLGMYAEAENYTIIEGKPVEEKSFDTSKPSPNEFSLRVGSGYDGQKLLVSEVHQGSFDSDGWVYFFRDDMWGYYCTSEPPAVNSGTYLYILSNLEGAGDEYQPRVSQVYPVSSEFAKSILAQLDGEPVPPVVPVVVDPVDPTESTPEVETEPEVTETPETETPPKPATLSAEVIEKIKELLAEISRLIAELRARKASEA